jgi:hypothetical protein
VHSAWCPPKKSEYLTVELKRSELSGLEWLDGEGGSTDNGLAEETLKMGADCNGDMEEGAWVMFRVYREGADAKRDKPASEKTAQNKEGRAEAEWAYEYRHDSEKPLTKKPKYFFTANAQRCKEAKSGNVEIGMDYRILLQTADDDILENTNCEIYFSDGTKENGTIDSDGYILFENKVPGVALRAEYTAENDEITANAQRMTGVVQKMDVSFTGGSMDYPLPIVSTDTIIHVEDKMPESAIGGKNQTKAIVQNDVGRSTMPTWAWGAIAGVAVVVIVDVALFIKKSRK